jgi:FkbM family methyltransferase
MSAAQKRETVLAKHWRRLKRSLGRRWREWRLPRGFRRLGTRYGGWWLYFPAVGEDPLLVDCGLGRDISFPVAFLERFGGRVIGVDPNPAAVEYASTHRPSGMEVRAQALWSEPGRTLTFHMPRPLEQLPQGADGVSGSLLASHGYAGGGTLSVPTTSFDEILASARRGECDVLKLDVEGAEYEVLNALCASGSIRRARQVLVEFHHGWTEHPLQHTLDTAARVEASGFDLAYVENRNYLFVRRDVARSHAAG